MSQRRPTSCVWSSTAPRARVFAARRLQDMVHLDVQQPQPVLVCEHDGAPSSLGLRMIHGATMRTKEISEARDRDIASRKAVKAHAARVAGPTQRGLRFTAGRASEVK